MSKAVKMKESLGSRLSTTAQDVAYAAAKGIEGTYGPSVRRAIRDLAGATPPGQAAETIKRRKNNPLDY